MKDGESDKFEWDDGVTDEIEDSSQWANGVTDEEDDSSRWANEVTDETVTGVDDGLLQLWTTSSSTSSFAELFSTEIEVGGATSRVMMQKRWKSSSLFSFSNEWRVPGFKTNYVL